MVPVELGYRTHVPPYGTRFIPLYEVRDERYSIYFRFQSLTDSLPCPLLFSLQL
jgi:hypothetical protein